MIAVILETLTTIDANEQALRAADASWESARWAFLMLLVTVGLLIGAFLAARYARKTWEATSAQLRMAQAADREREARNVSAWLQPAKSGNLMEVFARNGNGGPAYDVVCRIMVKRMAEKVPTDEVHIERYVALGPDDTQRAVKYAFNMGPDGYTFGYKDPNDGVRYTKSRTTTVLFESDDEWKIWDGQSVTDGLAVDLSFRDSAGRSWRRDWHGKLIELT
ncbi:hypothetical protein [Arthrobacter sp. UYCo732]|uniref:hypothetical protein n=1 Tax=Arthrobacter sp. UYCo732 TaxID=3156336 RepID=UPI003396B132